MAKILQFQLPRIPVVACCDTCYMTRRVLLREAEYERYAKGSKKICPCCNHPTLYYCIDGENEE